MFFSATSLKVDPAQKKSLSDFGKYVADCLPKYVQKVQIALGNELEVSILDTECLNEITVSAKPLLTLIFRDNF